MHRSWNAVFKGGGAKGIAYAGALEACERWGIEFKEVAGSSAGAITATLVACDYKAEEIVTLTSEALEAFDSVPRAMAMVGLRSSLLDSERLHDLLQRRIADKVVIDADGEPDYDPHDPPQCTFKDIHEKFGIKLHVVTLDLATRQPLVFSPDLTPDSPVAPAVVASSAIPVAFPASRMMIKGKVHRLVDGGTWSNYPSFVFFDKDFRHRHGLEPTTGPTIGFILDDKDIAFDHTAPDDDPDGGGPQPVDGAGLLSDDGSSVNELKLPGAILSSALFRWSLGIVPFLFVLLSLRWLHQELNSPDPLIEAAPPQLQDLIVLASIVVLALTGLLAMVMAFLVLRLGRTLFDTGVVGASAAMGVGPGVAYWVGSRSDLDEGLTTVEAESDDLDRGEEHIAIRIDVPTDLTTLNFAPDEDLKRRARRRGWEATERALRVASATLGLDTPPDPDDVPDTTKTVVSVARPNQDRAWHRNPVRLWVPAVIYALVAGTIAAFNAMIGFAEEQWLLTAFWVAVVGSAVLVGIGLVATMRTAEATKPEPYPELALVGSPKVPRAIAAAATLAAVAVAWYSFSLTEFSFFTTIRADTLVGEVVGDGPDPFCDLGDAAPDVLTGTVVAFGLNPADWDEAPVIRLALTQGEAITLVDLTRQPVEYCNTTDPTFNEDNGELLVAFTPPRGLELKSEVDVYFNTTQGLAYLEDDLDAERNAKYWSLGLLILSLALLVLALRSLRAAKWMKNQFRQSTLAKDRRHDQDLSGRR